MKLIEHTIAEISHKVEFFNLYKYAANILFVILIIGSFYMSLIGGEPERLKYQIQAERKEFSKTIKSERLKFYEYARSEHEKIDSLQWYKEIMKPNN